MTNDMKKLAEKYGIETRNEPGCVIVENRVERPTTRNDVAKIFGLLTGEDLEFLAKMSKRETGSEFFEKEKK